MYIHFRILPRKERKSAVLEQRMHENSTLIIYESPHRVTDTLKQLQDRCNTTSITGA